MHGQLARELHTGRDHCCYGYPIHDAFKRVNGPKQIVRKLYF